MDHSHQRWRCGAMRASGLFHQSPLLPAQDCTSPIFGPAWYKCCVPQVRERRRESEGWWQVQDLSTICADDKYSISMKISTHLDYTSHYQTSFGTNWSKLLTFRVFIIDTNRDEITSLDLNTSIYEKYLIGPSIRPVCTRCRFTMLT